jgi:hypothetical protein
VGRASHQTSGHDSRQVSRSKCARRNLLLKTLALQLYSPDAELVEIVENIFRLSNILLLTDTTARIEIFRSYAIEPLCLHWATSTDSQQEEINIPAAKLWSKLNREELTVDATLQKEAMEFLVK